MHDWRLLTHLVTRYKPRHSRVDRHELKPGNLDTLKLKMDQVGEGTLALSPTLRRATDQPSHKLMRDISARQLMLSALILTSILNHSHFDPQSQPSELQSRYTVYYTN